MPWDGVEKRKEVIEHTTQLAVLANDVGYIKETVQDIKRLVEDKYVTKSEFEPIKRIVYGVVGLILVAVVGALLTLVVRK